MKKITLTLWLFLIKLALIAQLNPVNDFDYSQFYDFGNTNCPSYNCFLINWSPPDNSMDTLIGYKLFKDNQAWIFTAATSIGCDGYSPCTYPDFYNETPFYLKVRAVYNSDSCLSPAVDSAYINYVIIGIPEYQADEVYLISNPVKAGEFISLSLGKYLHLCENINVISTTGQLILKHKQNNTSGAIQYIPSAGLHSGVYLIEVTLKSEKKYVKVVIQ